MMSSKLARSLAPLLARVARAGLRGAAGDAAKRELARRLVGLGVSRAVAERLVAQASAAERERRVRLLAVARMVGALVGEGRLAPGEEAERALLDLFREPDSYVPPPFWWPEEPTVSAFRP